MQSERWLRAATADEDSDGARRGGPLGADVAADRWVRVPSVAITACVKVYPIPALNCHHGRARGGRGRRRTTLNTRMHCIRLRRCAGCAL